MNWIETFLKKDLLLFRCCGKFSPIFQTTKVSFFRGCRQSAKFAKVFVLTYVLCLLHVFFISIDSYCRNEENIVRFNVIFLLISKDIEEGQIFELPFIHEEEQRKYEK